MGSQKGAPVTAGRYAKHIPLDFEAVVPWRNARIYAGLSGAQRRFL
ncbi:MAG: hypothetical protein IJ072_05690 [Oscillospiraceae bacterium]|nr:hypothetical protein [Oscillospiraceae bacterium]